jgi:hypothetical protein
MAMACGTALSESDRAKFGLGGLLPPAVQPLSLQVALVLKQMRACHTQLQRYTLLSDLHDHNHTLFYRSETRNPKPEALKPPRSSALNPDPDRP